jgi:hypothetical protein
MVDVRAAWYPVGTLSSGHGRSWLLSFVITRLIMRGSFFPTFLPLAHFIRRWPRMAIGLIGSVLIGTLGAADDSEKKVARLGFAFDPKAHEAAVAAAANGESASENPGDDPSSSDVLHLPKYTVTGKRVPFNERDTLTPKGKLILAKKTYLTPAYQKTLGPLSALASLIMNPLGGWQPNDPEAMSLYEDAEQKRRNTEMSELVHSATLSEQAARRVPADKRAER